MVKRMFLILILAVFVAGGAFAEFWMETAVSTNFNSVTPTFGFGISLKPLDILWGFGLGLWGSGTSARTNYYRYMGSSGFNMYGYLGLGYLNDPNFDYVAYYYSSLYDDSPSSWGAATGGYNILFYAGVAPKSKITDRWSITFPMLMQWGINNSKYTGKGYYWDINFELAILVGARAYYAFTKDWSLFTGFNVNALSWGHTASYGGWTIVNNVAFFNTGNVQLGIRYLF